MHGHKIIKAPYYRSKVKMYKYIASREETYKQKLDLCDTCILQFIEYVKERRDSDE